MRYGVQDAPQMGFAKLFCVGKPPVKHGFDTPCYPMGMVLLLLFLVFGLLVVISVDMRQKRLAFLCQQEEMQKRS